MKPDGRTFDVIHWMLSQRPAACDPPQPLLGEWESAHQKTAGQWTAPMDRAIAGGFVADRLAWAMTAGYREALRQLVPDLSPVLTPALCVTETGGGHPRAIKTRLVPAGKGRWEITGKKRFITHADRADLLLVAAKAGTGPDGRPQIRMAAIPAAAPGVAIETMPDLAFVPEIAHGALALDKVRINGDQLLAGDGYADYVKPFRTIEDIHIFGAVSGYLAGTAARFAWPEPCRSELLALVATLRTLSGLDPLSPLVHILLHGVFLQLNRWIKETGPFWNRAPDRVQERWHRDRPLLKVAENAREKRFESALKPYSGPGQNR